MSAPPAPEPPAAPRGLVFGAFGLMVLIAGTNFVAVKISNEGLAPFWGAALRFLVAGALFGWLAVALRIPFPRGRGLLGAALYGSIGFGAAYALAYLALVGINANLVAILGSTVPLITILLASVHGLERVRIRAVASAVAAAAGLVIILARGGGFDVSLPHLAAGVLFPFAIAESSIVAKQFPRSHPFATNAVGMLLGGVLLVIGSVAVREPHVLPPAGRVAGAYLYLVLVGSVVFFTLFLFVLRHLDVSAVMYQMVLAPIVAAAMAALLVGEAVTMNLVLGGVIVLVSVYFGAIRRSPAVKPAAAGAPQSAASTTDAREP